MSFGQKLTRSKPPKTVTLTNNVTYNEAC